MDNKANKDNESSFRASLSITIDRIHVGFNFKTVVKITTAHP